MLWPATPTTSKPRRLCLREQVQKGRFPPSLPSAASVLDAEAIDSFATLLTISTILWSTSSRRGGNCFRCSCAVELNPPSWTPSISTWRNSDRVSQTSLWQSLLPTWIYKNSQTKLSILWSSGWPSNQINRSVLLPSAITCTSSKSSIPNLLNLLCPISKLAIHSRRQHRNSKFWSYRWSFTMLVENYPLANFSMPSKSKSTVRMWLTTSYKDWSTSSACMLYRQKIQKGTLDQIN